MSKPWPVRALVVVLLLGVLAAVALIGVGLWLELGPREPSNKGEAEGLGDGDEIGRNMALAAVILLTPMFLAASVPLLFALRRPRPRLARAGLLLLLISAALYLVLFIADIRDPADCPELEGPGLVIPAWLAAAVLLAFHRRTLEALGCGDSGFFRGLRVVVLALAAVVL